MNLFAMVSDSDQLFRHSETKISTFYSVFSVVDVDEESYKSPEEQRFDASLAVFDGSHTNVNEVLTEIIAEVTAKDVLSEEHEMQTNNTLNEEQDPQDVVDKGVMSNGK